MDKDVDRFRVIIGSSHNLRQQYADNFINNHDTKNDEGNINIMDKLVEPSVEKTCNDLSSINIIVIGRQLNMRKKKNPLNYYKEIIVDLLTKTTFSVFDEKHLHLH